MLIEILNFSSLGVTVISCPKFINSLAQILAFNFVVTLALIGKDTEVNISPGLSYGWATATPVKGSPERACITEATDPCTVASASRVTLGEVLTRASWTGVSISADGEADFSDTIKGVKDWITACDTALAMPSTIDVDVGVGVDVDMDVDAEVKGPVRTRLARGASGPELRATFLVRDGRGIILWGNKIKTKQNRQQAKQDQTRS